jgi:hypothetical protein
LPYLARHEAHARFGGRPGHIYQGDLFQTLTFMVPRVDGSWDDRQWDGIVASHDCEHTKIYDKPAKPLLVAPVRPLSDYQQRDAIVAGRAYALWLLPGDAPLDDDEYVADLRLVQPMAVGALEDATYWASLDQELKEVFQGRLANFLVRADLVRP